MKKTTPYDLALAYLQGKTILLKDPLATRSEFSLTREIAVKQDIRETIHKALDDFYLPVVASKDQKLLEMHDKLSKLRKTTLRSLDLLLASPIISATTKKALRKEKENITQTAKYHPVQEYKYYQLYLHMKAVELAAKSEEIKRYGRPGGVFGKLTPIKSDCLSDILDALPPLKSLYLKHKAEFLTFALMPVKRGRGRQAEYFLIALVIVIYRLLRTGGMSAELARENTARVINDYFSTHSCPKFRKLSAKNVDNLLLNYGRT